MFKTRYIGFSIGTGFVADGHFNEFQVKLGRPKDQVEIAKGIELAKIASVSCQFQVVFGS
jgi:hypothetical protein